MKRTVSIIVRTRNEERWISSCLSAVFRQEYKDFEVIIVDNNSTDKTVDKAKQFDVKIISIIDFLPGKAINYGIRHSSGEYICCLSGHCIPTNKNWLSNLLKNIELPNVAGVYGRQEPLSFTSDLDKRDLLVTFGLDRKVQKKDPFFHNANSLIKREIWRKVPFDEQVTNIEDRIWAKQVLQLGYEIIYEPDASVYHHHGIHQALNAERCKKIVKILETLEFQDVQRNLDLEGLCAVGIIPLKGEILNLNHKPLFSYTLEHALESKYLKYIVLASDNPAYLDLINKKSNNVIYIERPDELSMDYIEIEDILKYALGKLEKRDIFPDIVVYMSIMYPFRPEGLIDNAINLLIEKGLDTVIPTIAEYRSCWREENGNLIRIDEGFIPKQYKNPLHIGITGLITATHAEFIRRGERLGPKVGMLELDDIFYSLDVGKNKNMKIAEKMLKLC